jgi:hypothetical protein
MRKLINAYRADKSLKNAQKIAVYERKHPFCRLMLSIEDDDLVAEALRQTN